MAWGLLDGAAEVPVLKSPLPLISCILALGAAASVVIAVTAPEKHVQRPALVATKTHPPASKALKTENRPAEPAAPVYVFDIDLARTPSIALDDMRFAILGLGQDATTGRQIVWVRSILTNRIDGFARGEALFGSPVRVQSIRRDAVVLAHGGRMHALSLP